ncbi:MAG: hypothetical protein AAGA80_19205 [Cyanobacteria bacterium P01_F01_bin.143]
MITFQKEDIYSQMYLISSEFELPDDTNRTPTRSLGSGTRNTDSTVDGLCELCGLEDPPPSPAPLHPYPRPRKGTTIPDRVDSGDSNLENPSNLEQRRPRPATTR